MTDAISHTFPKAEKLKSRKQIDLLFREGKSFFAAPVKCFYRISNSNGQNPNSKGGDEIRSTKYEIRNEGNEGELRHTQYEVEIEGINENPLTEWEPALIKNCNEEILSGKVGFNYLEGSQTPIPNAQTHITINHKQQTTNIKAGFSVSKKQFKKAVDRNRVKRLMREAYRLHKHKLKAQVEAKNMGLEIFFVFTDKTLPDFKLVEEKIKYCLRRLGKIMEDNG